jgi:hypothetical protein
LKKAINNPDEYKKNMRWVNYVIEGIQSAISKNPEVVGYIKDYFKLSDDEIESIRNSTAWMESKDSFIKNFIKENTDENGFKVVDYSETLYHGSTTPVSKFSLSGDGRMGKGLYLTTDKDWAEFYAQGGRQGKSGQKLSDKQGHIYQFKVEGKAAVVTDEQEFLDYIRSNYEPMEDEFSKYGDWSNAVVAHVSGWAKEEGIDIVVSPGEGILTAFPQALVVSEGVAKQVESDLQESFFSNFIDEFYDDEWGIEPEDFGFAKENNILKELTFSDKTTDKTLGGASWQNTLHSNKSLQELPKRVLDLCSDKSLKTETSLSSKSEKRPLIEWLQSYAKGLVWNSKNWSHHVNEYFRDRSTYHKDDKEFPVEDVRELFLAIPNTLRLDQIKPIDDNAANFKHGLFRGRVDDSVFRVIFYGKIEDEYFWIDSFSFFNYNDDESYKKYLIRFDNNEIERHESKGFLKTFIEEYFDTDWGSELEDFISEDNVQEKKVRQ